MKDKGKSHQGTGRSRFKKKSDPLKIWVNLDLIFYVKV